jgi:membrane-bound lytic murein transglycosylase D
MDLFRQALQREGLPPDLVHLVFVESGFNLNARSVSHAVGPWQFLQGTAKLFGLTVNQWIDERRDPEKSTVAAARYLKHLYTNFGAWPLALASYNAGEGTVLRAIKAQGTTNYWDLNLPRQTEEYVPQFMAILAISRDPRKYGFDGVSLDEPMAFDEVALKGAVDLRALARLADCSYDELKLLNPAVLHQAASGANGVTMLRVPRGKGEALMQKLNGGARLPAVDLTLRHRVARGETLNRIATHYHVSPSRLALANGIGRKRPLRRGMTLVIPASLGAPAPAQLGDNDPRASTAYVPPRVGLVSKSMVQGRSDADGRTIHRVARGETLAGIAAHYEVSIDDLKAWNRLKRVNLVPGQRLKVRPASAPEATAEASAPAPTSARLDGDAKPQVDAQLAQAKPTVTAVADDDRPAKRTSHHKGTRTHARATITVHRGATLSSIAKQHGVTINELKRANGLRSNEVRAGQRLRLPA